MLPRLPFFRKYTNKLTSGSGALDHGGGRVDPEVIVATPWGVVKYYPTDNGYGRMVAECTN